MVESKSVHQVRYFFPWQCEQSQLLKCASYLNYLTLENGTVKLSQKVSKELPVLHWVISHKSANLIWWSGDAGLGLTLYGVVLSDLVWRRLSQCFIYEFRTTSNIKAPNLTLSDPTSDLVRHYDFPVPLQCQKTSDTFLLHPLRCWSLSDTFPHVVQTLANRQRSLYPFCFSAGHVFWCERWLCAVVMQLCL
jgi:hypothetical protein